MLEGWHEFYVLIGTAAAALLALLFVAVSIGAGFLSRENAGATRTFMSPVVFHYTAVLFLSLIVLIPVQTSMSLGLSIGFVAAIGLSYSIVILARVVRAEMADMADNFGYGASPVAAYAAALVAAWLLLSNSSASLNVLAGALLLLLVVNIRNAWDTTLSLARRATEQRTKNESQTTPNQSPSP
jgi:hypothetical protein